VLLTGARTSTLLQRLPFLPAADAFASENGAARCGDLYARGTAADQWQTLLLLAPGGRATCVLPGSCQRLLLPA
jgi:hypothetical protein